MAKHPREVRIGDIVRLRIGSNPMVVFDAPPQDVNHEGLIGESCSFVSCWQAFGHSVNGLASALEPVEQGGLIASQLLEVGDVVELRLEKVSAVVADMQFGSSQCECLFYDQDQGIVRRIKIPCVAIKKIETQKEDVDFFDDFVRNHPKPSAPPIQDSNRRRTL